MELKILGSVSPYCHLEKNCPGFLITSGENKVLFDCGNGATRVMDMERDLQNLTIIISHLHKDHYGDLLSLAYASYVYHRLGMLKDRINVYIPKDDLIEIREYYTDEDGWGAVRNIEVPIMDYKYLTDENYEHYFNFINYNENTKLNIDNMHISFKKTQHPINTYAAKLETDDYKLCYSADTGYDENLCDFFKASDLLICESTFLKGQMRNENNHLYAHEAGKLAKLSDVKKLMLTHFWPEIEKDRYLNEAKKEFDNVDISVEGKKLILRRD